MEKKEFQTQYKTITVRTIDGSTLYGKVNIGANNRVSEIFTKSEISFIVMVDVSYKDGLGKIMFVNKNHIVWVEPEE